MDLRRWHSAEKRTFPPRSFDSFTSDTISGGRHQNADDPGEPETVSYKLPHALTV